MPRKLSLSDVPAIPDDAIRHANPNGSAVYTDGRDRWRLNAAGDVIYYIHLAPDLTTHEAVYATKEGRGRP